MSLESPYKFRERIVAFGMEGTGKSSLLLNIARYTDHTVHIFDQDMGIQMLMELQYPDLLEKGNVEVFDADVDGDPDDPWMTYVEWVKKMRVDVKDLDDWVGVDSVTPAWEAVQNYFSEQVFGKSSADYFLAARVALEQQRRPSEGDGKAAKAENFQPFEGLRDWQPINKMYARDFANHLLRIPCHLLVTAEETLVTARDKTSDPELNGMYGVMGVRPKGQKRIGSIMSTVIRLQKTRTGVWKMTNTVKDRGRAEVDGLAYDDFALEYLAELGGWVDR